MLMVMPQFILQDESTDSCPEGTEAVSPEGPEEPESTHIVISAADSSLVRTAECIRSVPHVVERG